MSGTNDPIPSNEIDKHLPGGKHAEGGGGTTSDDSAGFVENAQAETPQVVNPSKPEVDVPPMSQGASSDGEGQLAVLTKFVREQMPDGAKDLDKGQPAVEIVIAWLEKMVTIPGQSLLPSVTYDNDLKNVVETTVCESISGGQDETNGMPNQIRLVRKCVGESQPRIASYRIT